MVTDGARVSLVLHGADARLHAAPQDLDGARIPSELFRIAVARRLRLKLVDEHSCCPCCGVALDAYMDHALVCACGGCRTRRHNAIRDACHGFAVDSGIQATKEKPGLLPPRPGEEVWLGRAQITVDGLLISGSPRAYVVLHALLMLLSLPA